MLWPSTLRWRLTLWYTALLGAPLIALAVGSYLVFRRTLYSRTDQFTGDALAAFSRELGAERRATGGALEAIRTTADEVRFPDLHIAVFDTTGVLVAMTPTRAEPDINHEPPKSVDTWIVAAVQPRGTVAERPITVRHADTLYRVVGRSVTIDNRRYDLTGTYSLAEIEEVLERVRGTFTILIPLLIVCAATGGYFLATRSLSPIKAMGARAADISATNLRERLPVSGGEELAGLARVVNDLLDRLEASFAQQRRFMADASHELRTPTAILRTEADVTLAQPHRSESDYRASVEIMQGAARRMTRIVDDLFLLARADAGKMPARRELVYLEEIVHDATRAARPLAESRGIRVELREAVEAPIEGDSDLLGQLFLNLLDNAIKYSPRGSTVEVIMKRHRRQSLGNGAVSRAARYEISVVDAGIGIPPDERERIFERFVRLDAARAGAEATSTSGAGLGLAIARRIAELHGGKLELAESRPGRTEFRVSLSAAADSDVHDQPLVS